MTSTPERFDALVIGAGAGGLSAAALLAHHGYRTLVVESRDRVGGRASSIEDRGFTVNTGAVAIEYGGRPSILSFGVDMTEHRRMEAALLQTARLAAVPVPMAMPRSALLIDTTSLTPSPIIATTWPRR